MTAKLTPSVPVVILPERSRVILRVGFGGPLRIGAATHLQFAPDGNGIRAARDAFGLGSVVHTYVREAAAMAAMCELRDVATTHWMQEARDRWGQDPDLWPLVEPRIRSRLTEHFFTRLFEHLFGGAP